MKKKIPSQHLLPLSVLLLECDRNRNFDCPQRVPDKKGWWPVHDGHTRHTRQASTKGFSSLPFAWNALKDIGVLQSTCVQSENVWEHIHWKNLAFFQILWHSQDWELDNSTPRLVTLSWATAAHLPYVNTLSCWVTVFALLRLLFFVPAVAQQNTSWAWPVRSGILWRFQSTRVRCLVP